MADQKHPPSGPGSRFTGYGIIQPGAHPEFERGPTHPKPGDTRSIWEKLGLANPFESDSAMTARLRKQGKIK